MSTQLVSSKYSPQRRPRHRHNTYSTPRSRRKNIRTVADVATPPSNYPSADHTHPKRICCICLEVIYHSDTAGIDCCDHLYHKDCIESWSRIENACPLCKKRFESIHHISDDNKTIPVAKKNQEAAYHIDLGHIIWVDCVCSKCGSDDNEHLLLLCDGCDAAVHTYCVGLGDHVPDGDYFCDMCQCQIDGLFLTYPTAQPHDESESDEEYHPSPPHSATRRRSVRNANRERRRSQRIRNSQRPAANIDINMESRSGDRNHNDNNPHHRYTRARSLSPVSPNNRIRDVNRNNNDNNNNNNNNSTSRAQRMMVMDQNNNRHLLGFKRNTHGVRFSSLANLFAHSSSNRDVATQPQGKIQRMARKTSLCLLRVDIHNVNDAETTCTESEYTPSDEDHDDTDSEYDCDCDIQRIDRRHVRRSRRLQNRKAYSDSEEDSDVMVNTGEYRKSRKRTFSQIQEANDDVNATISARKRAKTATRKYSSLVLL